MRTYLAVTAAMLAMSALMVAPAPDALHLLWVTPVLALWAAGTAFGLVGALMLRATRGRNP